MKKVSVILLCYNHEQFVEQAIKSVLDQEYPEKELIVVDDASTDRSASRLKDLQKEHGFELILNPENLGICRSFNLGFSRSSGDFIIDLAADDYLLPGKLEIQVKQFSELPTEFGVVFSDAQLIDKDGNDLGTHMGRVRGIGKVKEVPQGDIFRDLLEYFFVSAATQMVKREVLEELGGYDEGLTYEDFDFWIRSSRKWKYAYSPEKLMGLRKLSTGMSSNMYGPNDPKVESTFKVVNKARDLIRSDRESAALLSRVKYELRMSFKYKNKKMLNQWFDLYRELGGKSLIYKMMKLIRG